MIDLVSRQEAIDALTETEVVGVCWKGGYIQRHNDFHEAINCIKELPSAEPKKGKWIKADSQQYFRKHYPAFTCSECGHRKDSQKTWNYCPNCGAKMEAEHE